MKKKCSALLAVILAIAMLVTTMPSMVFAAGTSAAEQVGKYFEVDANGRIPDQATLTEGNTQKSYENEFVTVDKKIESVSETENKFEITLNVTTKEKIASEVDSTDAAAVLVIDTSGSMDFSTGGWHGTSRLEAAKRAAQAFINKFVAENANRKIAIVAFNETATTKQTWTDAAKLKTDSDRRFCDALLCLEAGGGTNIDAGLQSAKELLDSLQDIKNKNVVLLTDGQPTYYLDSNGSVQGDGSNASKKICDHTEASATALKNAGYGMYAVYAGGRDDKVTYGHWGGFLGLEWITDFSESATTWLSKYCGFQTFYADNTNGLTKIFEGIVKLIELKAQAWILTDPMGEMVKWAGVSEEPAKPEGLAGEAYSYDADTATLTWDLKNTVPTESMESPSGDTTTHTYTYTMSYFVELNTLHPNFEAGKEYPANQTTSMTYLYTDSTKPDEMPTLKTAYLNIPSVKGFAGSYEFTKRDEATKNPLGGVEFTLTTKDDSSWSKVVYSDAYGKVTIDNLPSGHTYALRETTPLPGYQADATAYAMPVAYGVASSQKLSSKNNNTIFNESATYTTLPVEKIWADNGNNDGKRPDSVTVGLYEVDENGNAAGEPVQTITIQDDGQGNWVGQFKNVPMARDGQLIGYTVKEVAVPDYTGVVNEVRKDDQLTGFEITNTHADEQVILTITKKWKDNDDAAQKRPESVSVALNANGDKVGMVTLNAENDWTATVEMPKYRDGQEITYTILEEEVPGYTASYDQLTLTVTNTFGEGEETTLNLVKIWNDNDNNDGKRPDAIDVEILANGQTVKTVTLRADDGWKADITLPKYENGVEIEYTIRERDVPAGYTVSYDGMTITNTSDGNEQTTLAITKTWKDDDNKAGKRPDSIEVEILADGQVVKTVTLAAKDGWKIEVQLDKYLNGKAITYTVQEKGVPEGYTAAYDQSALTITNTYKSEPAPTPTPTPATPSTPATGGTGTAMLWMTLMVAAAAMLIGSVLLKKKLNA